MPLTPMTDCTTPVEDMKLLYSKDYMALVSSGVGSLGGRTDAYRRLPASPAAYSAFDWQHSLRPHGAPYFHYMSGLASLGETWPPGQRPEPYRWTDSRGNTYTLVMLDGKWMYRDSKRKLFVSPSNLLDMMGVKKDPATNAPAPGEVVPGTPTSKAPAGALPAPGQLGPAGPPGPSVGWNLSTMQIGGLSAGWAVILGVGGYMMYRHFKKKRGG